MAGTDHTQAPILGGPAIVLVKPQMGENIGASARAMYNFGLTDLRLVAPRDGWPSDKAVAMASGASPVIEGTQVFETTAAAVGSLHHLYATTARDRYMIKPVMTAEAAAQDMRARTGRGEAVGILFGGEKAGLHNDDVAIADTIVTVPVNPAFASINLAQAVLLLSYEWFKQADATPAVVTEAEHAKPATRAEILAFFDHLEQALDDAGFLFPPEKRPGMVRNLRNMWHRVALTHQDVQTLRGMIKALQRTDPVTGKRLDQALWSRSSGD
ncbi:MAG: RNA methyltransferase [Alphaproteobacteria bacterium]